MPEFARGDKVQSISDPSRVGVVTETGRLHGGVQYYEIHWGGAVGWPVVAESDLKSFTPAHSPRENLQAGNLAGYGAFQRLMTYHRLRRTHPLRNTIYAFNASRTRFYPYQFKPLIKLIDSHSQRILIADEVGLGKTIEAGLILTELRARYTLQRVLVICPAKLTEDKWYAELKQRFGETFTVFTARSFMQYLDEYERDPEGATVSGIISFETIRAGRVLERLETLSPHFNLVIVDEAHHMRNFGTKQRRVGVVLGDSSDAMALLTATPIQLGQDDLFSLLNLLDTEDFPDKWSSEIRFRDNEPIVRAQICMGQLPPNTDTALEQLSAIPDRSWVRRNPLYETVLDDLQELASRNEEPTDSNALIVSIQRSLADINLLSHIFTRTKKRDVHQHFPKRNAHAVTVQFSVAEQRVYDAVTELVRLESDTRGQMPVIQQWRINVAQQRMASSIPAMIRHYLTLPRPAEETPDYDDETAPDSLIEQSPGHGTPMLDFTQRLRDIAHSWPDDGPDSKYAQFITILERLRSEQMGPIKVMVFAFFKGTLYYLKERLRHDGFRVELICGDVPMRNRGQRLNSFRNDPEVEILLSSRVGSEGLDFEFCDILFNYDLPWNPMELEQRIGRLDRIGQESSIINIYHMWVEGTIEERILRRLYDRIHIFERSIGEIEAIIGDIARDMTTELFSRSLTADEEEAKARRILLNLDRRLVQIEELESEAAQFVGTDQFFVEEVSAIHERRRYVTSIQIHRYLTDFLRTTMPNTRLEYDAEEGIGHLRPCNELRRFLQRHGVASETMRFMNDGPGGVEMTFDSDTAFNRPNIEFVNVLHPLIQAITAHYAISTESIPNASHVVLETNTLDAGFYYYFVFRLHIVAAKGRTTVECVLLDEDCSPAADFAIAETVLGEMLELGIDPVGQPILIPRDAAITAFRVAEERFLEYRLSCRHEFERSNASFVEQRMASLSTFYARSLSKKRSLLERAQAAERQERYIRMLQGTIRRIENEQEQKTLELESQRQVQDEHEAIAAGVLEVL